MARTADQLSKHDAIARHQRLQRADRRESSLRSAAQEASSLSGSQSTSKGKKRGTPSTGTTAPKARARRFDLDSGSDSDDPEYVPGTPPGSDDGNASDAASEFSNWDGERQSDNGDNRDTTGGDRADTDRDQAGYRAAEASERRGQPRSAAAGHANSNLDINAAIIRALNSLPSNTADAVRAAVVEAMAAAVPQPEPPAPARRKLRFDPSEATSNGAKFGSYFHIVQNALRRASYGILPGFERGYFLNVPMVPLQQAAIACEALQVPRIHEPKIRFYKSQITKAHGKWATLDRGSVRAIFLTVVPGVQFTFTPSSAPFPVTPDLKAEILADHVQHLPQLAQRVTGYDIEPYAFNLFCDAVVVNGQRKLGVCTVPEFQHVYKLFQESLPPALRHNTIQLVIFIITSLLSWCKMDDSGDEILYGQYDHKHFDATYIENLKEFLLDESYPTDWPVLTSLRQQAAEQARAAAPSA